MQGFRVMCHNDYLVKQFHSPKRFTKHELVYDPRGVVITHVVVSYNRTIEKGESRARFYQPRCEFIHGKLPSIRKYPNVRDSVWGNYADRKIDEWYECPAGVPFEDSHEYSALCLVCHKRRTLSMCWTLVSQSLSRMFPSTLLS